AAAAAPSPAAALLRSRAPRRCWRARGGALRGAEAQGEGDKGAAARGRAARVGRRLPARGARPATTTGGRGEARAEGCRFE
ncbi:hypothetical protein EE612_041138, partial [Oryza sativa]